MDISNRLWDALNVLRGEVNVIHFKEIILPLFAYKAVSDNVGDPYIIEEEAHWSNLTSSTILLADKIHRAFQRIERTNSELNGVFTNFDYSRVSDNSLLSIVKMLDNLNLRRSKQLDPDPLCGTLARMTENLLENLNRIEGKMGTLSSTPPELATLIINLLDIRGGSLYDGVAGVGGFLVEGAKLAIKDTELAFYGQEKNPDTWAFAKMNFLLHGLHEVELAMGDTLNDPFWVEGDKLKKFDYIAMNPPFGLKWNNRDLERDPYERFARYGVPSASYGEMAFVLHAVASLKEHGKAVMLLSPGVLIRGGADEKNRKQLLEDDLVEAVIQLPKNLFTEVTIPVVILLLNKNKTKERKKKVQFILADKDYGVSSRSQNLLREEDVERIILAYRSGTDKEHYSRLVSLEEIEANEWSLNINRYVEEVEVETRIGNAIISTKVYQNSGIPKRRLGDVALLSRGMSPPKQETDHITHWLVNLVNVTKDGDISIDNLVPVYLSKTESAKHELHEGDLLLASRGSVMKIAVVPKTSERLVASNNFIVIRLNQYYDSYFLKAFLESPVGVHLLESQQRGTAITVLSKTDVSKIEVPDLPLQKQQQLASLFQNADVEYKKRIEEANRENENKYLDLYEKMGIAESIVETT